MWPVRLLAVAVPAAVGLGFGVQAGPDAEARQHAVRLQLQQVGGVEVLGVLERPAGQAHGRQRQRPGRVGDDVRYLLLSFSAGQDHRQAEQDRELGRALRSHGNIVKAKDKS